MSLSERIGSNIRRRRNELGLTQEQVGERADLDWTTTGAAERGVRNLSVESLLKIANPLVVTADDLVESMSVNLPSTKKLFTA